jgi:uncharacterized protein YggE
MTEQKGNTQIVVAMFGLTLLLIVAAFVLPWRRIDWGKVSYKPAEMVTVTGEAKSRQKNQIAKFNAGVDSVKDKKEEAVKEVNEKVAALIEAAKKFGIEEGDIQTQNLSIYQNEEQYWEGGSQKSRKGQWRVSNSVEITLRDVAKGADLADLLTSSGANNVYGPNFQFDDTSKAEKELFDAAMKDAKEKAELIAKSSGRKLGKVMVVNEGSGGPVFGVMNMKEGAGGAGGAPIEPGSGTVSKNLTVSFELK